jgi:uncharacterized membrane protein
MVNDARRKLDDKINNFIALSGVLVNAILGLAIIFLDKNDGTTLWLLLVSVILYLIVIATGLFSYRPVKFNAISIKNVIKKFEVDSSSQLVEPIEHLAWNLSKNADINVKILERKGGAFRLMLLMFGLAVFFLVLALATLGINAIAPHPVGNFTQSYPNLQ